MSLRALLAFGIWGLCVAAFNGGHRLCPVFDNYTFQGSAISVDHNFRSPGEYGIAMSLPCLLMQDECHSSLESNLAAAG